MAAVATGLLLFTACSEDSVDGVNPKGSALQFDVRQMKGWNDSAKSRAVETQESDAAVKVFTLQGENPADTLFLHATVTEGIEGASFGNEDSETRSAPVETSTFYDSFGVFTYVYPGSWSETLKPDYMYNVEVTKDSAWTTSYLWPGNGSKIKFFAYAPYNGAGITLSALTTAGTPSIGYTVPNDVADQKDLLIAASGELPGNASGTAPLQFGHALTAVKFVTGDNMMAGTVSKITISGVYSKATQKMGASTWGSYGTLASFSQTLSLPVDGTAGETITTPPQTFMMLPQILPGKAVIEIVFVDKTINKSWTLTASIKGSEWPIGKTVTYRISTTSLVKTYDFIVQKSGTSGEHLVEFPADGGNGKISLKSSLKMTQVVQGVNQAIGYGPVSWTAEFIEDDGQGGYRVIAQPDWITDFNSSGAGLADTYQYYTITAKAQTPVVIEYDSPLKNAAPVANYDLSTNGGTTPVNTANCYLVNAPGTYSLPLVYGNAVKNGETNTPAYYNPNINPSKTHPFLTTFIDYTGTGITSPYIYEKYTPADAVLVWQDAPGLVTNVALADNKTLSFEVPQSSIRQGNAVVAVRDASGVIMWSWHIWVTPYKLGSDLKTISYNGKKSTFMPFNIGWCAQTISSYPERSVKVRYTQTGSGAQPIIITFKQLPKKTTVLGNSTNYQWGRKDPLPQSIDVSSTALKTWYNAEGVASTTLLKADFTADAVTNISNSIKAPSTFSSQKFVKWYTNLWAAECNMFNDKTRETSTKTIYDPSPVGFKVPVLQSVRGLTKTGYGTTDTAQINGTYDADVKGWYFNCTDENGASTTSFFQLEARLAQGTGDVLSGNSWACWEALILLDSYHGGDFEYSPTNGIMFLSEGTETPKSMSLGVGSSIRPFKE